MTTATRFPHPATIAGAIAAALLVACGGGGDGDGDDPPPSTFGDTYALTAAGRIVTFDRATPGTVRSSAAVSGLVAGESLVGIDVRPADGLLYALGSSGRIYTVDEASGVATLKSTLAATPGDDNPYTALAGTSFGVDFNPVVDRLRVVSNSGQNLRINVDSGAAITDGAINGAATAVTASGYTNAFAAATTTTLYGIDAAAGTLVIQNPPNDGTQTTPRPLGTTATAANGFDIEPGNNVGYAALDVGGTTRLYTVALATGTATSVGNIGAGDALVGIALKPRAAPLVYVLTPDNRLARLDPAAPNTLSGSVAIAGLATGESVLGIDFRTDGRLYAVTTGPRVLVVDPATGATSGAVVLRADPTDATAPFTAFFGGIAHSVDFNPVADRLRVVSALSPGGANLRIDVDTGLVISDTPVNRAPVLPIVAGAAYSNSFAGATSTRLFDIDASQDVLAEQTPPNDGTLVNIGALGIDVASQSGVDIAGGDNGLVLAAMRNGLSGPYSLYTISLSTGAATLYRNTSGNAALSQIGGAGGPQIVDLAIRF